MPKNRKVKGFCAFCTDPVITGGKNYGGKWYHNPCYVAHSYGLPQGNVKGKYPRRSAPPQREMTERSESHLNPVEDNSNTSFNPQGDLEILAHAQNVTLASNPPGSKAMFFIYQGPRTAATNIVRFPTYQQANQYYRDVIDGKIGVSTSNPKPGMSAKWKIIVIGVSLVGVAALVFWLWKRRQTATKRKTMTTMADTETSMGTGTVNTDGFSGWK